jgi:hypothetical protein
MGPSCQDNNGRTEGKDCLVIQRQSYTQYWEDGCDAKSNEKRTRDNGINKRKARPIWRRSIRIRSQKGLCQA